MIKRVRASLAAPRDNVALSNWGVFAFTLTLGILTLVNLARSATKGGFEWANQDVAQTLYVARALLTGKRLYVDFAETNPPTRFLIAEVTSLAARVLHVSLIAAYHCFVVLVAILGSWVIRRVCSKPRLFGGSTLFGLSYALVLVGAGIPDFTGFTAAFGQREHLFALMLAPYVAWVLLDGSLTYSSAGVLYLLGVFTTFKPHFLGLVLLVELACAKDAARNRRARWSLLAAGVASPCIAWVLTSPASVIGFTKTTLPYLLGGAYATFNQPYALYVHSIEHRWFLIYTAAVAYFLASFWSSPRLPKSLRMTSLVLPPAAYLSVIQQHKFWDYHSIVAVCVSLMLAALLASLCLAELPPTRARTLLGVYASLITLGITLAAANRVRFVRDWQTGEAGQARLFKLAPLLKDRKRVLYYSTSITQMQLPLALNQELIGRYSHNFEYPVIIREPNQARRERLLDTYCAHQRELIRTAQPDAIVFHSTGQALDAPNQELHEVLVHRCSVIQAGCYESREVPEVPEAHVYLRGQCRTVTASK